MVDVRSPVEFKAGHIPNAFNLPLFTDDERTQIGICYKQQGKQKATILGIEFVGPRLKSMVDQAIQLSNDNRLILHCWRGGQRSQSLAWLLEKADLEVTVIKDGYKAFRNLMHEVYDQQKFKFLVLGGRTGSGKTNILQSIQNLNEQVLDLEKLAHHKGSAFGWIGENEQETNEQFENNLFYELYNLNHDKIIWLENESRTIGRNYIPQNLWKKIKAAPLINISLNMEERLNHLITCYDFNNTESLIESFKKIEKRLGHERTKKAIDLVLENKFKEAAQIALFYYDECYDYNLKENMSPEIHSFEYDVLDATSIANHLVQFKKNRYGE